MAREKSVPLALRVSQPVYEQLQKLATLRGCSMGAAAREVLHRVVNDGTLAAYMGGNPTGLGAPAPDNPPRRVLTEEELDNLFGEPDEVIITPGYEHVVAQREAEAAAAAAANARTNTSTPAPTPTTYDTARVIPIRAEPMPAAGSPAWVAMAQRNGVPQDTIDEHVAEYAAQQAAAQAQDVAYREHVIADIVPTAPAATTATTKPVHDLDDLFGPAST